MAFFFLKASRWFENLLKPATGNKSWSVDVRNVQGILAHGFDELAYATQLLVRFECDRSFGEWLLQHPPTSSLARGMGQAMNIAFSFRAMERLALPNDTLRGFAGAFREGLLSIDRCRRLGDLEANHPAGWDWGGPNRAALDAALMLFASTATEHDELLASIQGGLAAHGATIEHKIETRNLEGKEHFGFRSGIAQPAVGCEVSSEEAIGVFAAGAPHNTVAPGEFLLGYTNEFEKFPLTPELPCVMDPRNELPRARFSAGLKDLGRDGSYMVFRQLEQDVKGFWTGLDELSADAGARELLAAKLVGRWRSGVPLILSPNCDRPELGATDEFGYAKQDPYGLRCPFGAHIRRANPRDWRIAPESDVASLLSNRHRILRRSRPYGPPLVASLEPADILETPDDGVDRGLAFICFNADLERQFEMIQEAWLNNPWFAGLRDETDPLLGVSAAARNFTVPARPVSRRLGGLPPAVRVRGGGYFFLPSLAAVRFIANRLAPDLKQVS